MSPIDRREEALHAEQRLADRVHARIEELRQRAQARAEAAAADRSASTLQGRFERDVVAHHEASRSARFTFGDREQVIFGRLDRAEDDTLHVGRVSVLAEDGNVLLVDWRAPAAAPFYQATPAQPLGVARRRTLVTDGPTVVDLDDELLDTAAADRLGLDAVTGQGALLAALERTRTAHMRDIVATIQADQDRIIRLPDRGTVVVTGGPGTGKTVVALHRVAYLLYTHRARFEGRGVLVVGPSRAFTTYISRVLPSLGEDQAVLRPLDGFAPHGVTVRGWDEPATAAVKGDLRMAEVSRRAVAAVLPPIPPETRITFDGTTAVVHAGALGRSRRRLLDRMQADRDGQRYHDLRAAAEDAMRSVLWTAWRRARRHTALQIPEHRGASGFDAMVTDSARIEMLRRCFWPPLDAVEIFESLRRGDLPLADLADGALSPDEIERLEVSWRTTPAGTARLDDVALLDELAAILGDASEKAHDAEDDWADSSPFLSDRFRVHVPTVDATVSGYSDFAHVVVDEAQDLSPMQWRMVARRGPYASWTVVGDLAQRSRVAEPATWDEIAKLIGRRQVEIARLHVNYRTPTEVVAVARAVLSHAGLDPAVAAEAVREAGRRPQLVRTDEVAATAGRLAVAAAAAEDGTAAAIVDDADLEVARAAVDAALANIPPERREGVADRVSVLDPRTAKGLEFDEVVVGGPDVIGAASEVGWHLLYVAVTRATRHLTVVAAPDATVPGADLFAD